MARIARMMIAGEPAVYHVMSRTALDGFPFGDVEKDFFVDLLKRFSSLYFTEVLGFCCMGNHRVSRANREQSRLSLSGFRAEGIRRHGRR